MKTCLICGAHCPECDATCPKCGEASWGEVCPDTLPASVAKKPRGK